jgi:hypothetical protein
MSGNEPMPDVPGDPASQKENFIWAIATYVPEQLLAWVVQNEGVVEDYEELVKLQTEANEERPIAVARALVAAYEVEGQLHRFASALCRELRWAREFLLAATPFVVPPKTNHEAFYARRDNFFRGENLQRALDEHLPQVCCIVGRYELDGEVQQRSGTGFLVGPNLILTAMHVFGDLAVRDQARVPECFAVYFDHVKGEPLLRPNDSRQRVRRIQLASPSWLVASSPILSGDGRIDEPDAAMIATMRQRFDVALVALAEEVGAETLTPGGGRRRSWITLPASGSVTLERDSRIVIPQYPFGEPCSIDFGRYKERCRSGTRIRYNVEMGRGTSGAPCFDREFRIVGVHNAYFQVPGRDEANQAIYLDTFGSLIRPHLSNAAPPDVPLRLWNIARQSEPPRVVIGRELFLDFVSAGVGETATTARAGRVYAAVAPLEGSGKTFSVEILRAAFADRPAHRLIELGSPSELLPSQVESVARIIAERLGVPATEFASMPTRPGIDLPQGSLDGDKLRRWASELVPRWLLNRLEQARDCEVDKREAARSLIEQDRIFNRVTPADIVAIANSPEPVIERVEKWAYGWIAVDRLPESAMTPEVQDFVAALIGIGTHEASTLSVQRRLRWLFLGIKPDFLSETEATVEHLDPGQGAEQEVAAMLRSAFAAANQRLRDDEVEDWSKLIAGVGRVYDQQYTDKSKRYEWMQKLSQPAPQPYFRESRADGKAGPQVAVLGAAGRSLLCIRACRFRCSFREATAEPTRCSCRSSPVGRGSNRRASVYRAARREKRNRGSGAVSYLSPLCTEDGSNRGENAPLKRGRIDVGRPKAASHAR